MDVVSEFKKDIIKNFPKKRIVSLLFFGTRAFVGANNNSDYDLMLILNKYSPSDIFKLRKISQEKHFKDLDMNINLLYLADIKSRGKENFQLRSIPPSFYKYLEDAITLVGKNVFKEDSIKLSQNDLTKWMDFKIQEYYGRCDKLFLQNLNNQTLYKKIRKYIKDIIRFILIREKIMRTEDIVKFSFEDIFKLASKNKVFSKKLVYSFDLLFKKYTNSNDLKKIEAIRRKVYDKYLQVFSSRN